MKTVFTTRSSQTAPSIPLAEKPVPFVPVSAAGFPTDFLPPRLTAILLDAVRGQSGAIEEIRLRAGRKASLTVGGRNLMTEAILTESDLTTILTHMCGGSL